ADATQDFLDSPENASGTDSSDFAELTDDVATQDVAPPGVNKAPSFSPIANRAGLVGVPASLTIQNVTAGSGETQTLTFTATSSATGVVPNPSVSGSGSSRTLSFTPASAGTATITVRVQDDGGTANGGVDTYTSTFVVTVTAPAAPAITSSPITIA